MAYEDTLHVGFGRNRGDTENTMVTVKLEIDRNLDGIVFYTPAQARTLARNLVAHAKEIENQ